MPHHFGRSKRSTSRPNPHTSSGSSKATYVSSGAAQRQKTKVKANIDANKPSLIESIVSKSATLQVIKGIGEAFQKSSREYNLARRKKHITKYNTSVPPSQRIDMTDEMISSNEGLNTLREKTNYKTNQDINRERQDGGNGVNINQTTQVPKTILSPTKAEVSQSEAANAVNEEDPLYLRKKKTKAKGRSQTILTSSRGVTTDEGLTLGKKSLLGA